MFNAIMDISNFKPDRLTREWLRHDWKRKYINGDPKQGRKKWFNTKIVKHVAFIDGFHCSKMLMVILIVTALIIPFATVWFHYLIGYAVGYIAWNGSFMLFYKYIL